MSLSTYLLVQGHTMTHARHQAKRYCETTVQLITLSKTPLATGLKRKRCIKIIKSRVNSFHIATNKSLVFNILFEVFN